MAGAVLLLVITGLFTGPQPASAGSGVSEWCSQGWLGGTDGHYQEVSNNNLTGYLALNWGTPNTTPDFSVNVCYSDRALGTPSFAYGGMVHLGIYKPAPDTYHVYAHCYGEPSITATFNCQENGYVTVTTHTTPGVGFSVASRLDIAGSTILIGTTGADTGAINTTTGANPDATYGGLCIVAAGVIVPGTCAGGAADADVATGDLPTAFSGGTTGTCLLFSGGCLLYQPRGGVVLFDDAANNTQVTLFGVPVNDPGRKCVGFGC
jgi:hypothetical protein